MIHWTVSKQNVAERYTYVAKRCILPKLCCFATQIRSWIERSTRIPPPPPPGVVAKRYSTKKPASGTKPPAGRTSDQASGQRCRPTSSRHSRQEHSPAARTRPQQKQQAGAGRGATRGGGQPGRARRERPRTSRPDERNTSRGGRGGTAGPRWQTEQNGTRKTEEQTEQRNRGADMEPPGGKRKEALTAT